MGISPHFGIGGQELADPIYIQRCKEKWAVSEIAEKVNGCLHEQLNEGGIKNLLIFGEDSVGCVTDRNSFQKVFEKVPFKVVQDYFMTPTAEAADLILPATLPFETGGTYTNSQKVIQGFEAGMDSRVSMNSYRQLCGIMGRFGLKSDDNPHNILMEIISLLPESKNHGKFLLQYTEGDNNNNQFLHGCDSIVKRFEEEFSSKI
jgi:formate dehydrogenase major subunit